MNFFEAMTALQNGRKIRGVKWNKNEYIGLKEQQFKIFGLPKSEYSIVDITSIQDSNMTLKNWIP